MTASLTSFYFFLFFFTSLAIYEREIEYNETSNRISVLDACSNTFCRRSIECPLGVGPKGHFVLILSLGLESGEGAGSAAGRGWGGGWGGEGASSKKCNNVESMSWT